MSPMRYWHLPRAANGSAPAVRRELLSMTKKLRLALGIFAIVLCLCSQGRGPIVGPLEDTGFHAIFDGKSMSGWDGDPDSWRVENGALVGQTTTEKQPKQNTFLIWRGGSPADFELKCDFKLNGV